MYKKTKQLKPVTDEKHYLKKNLSELRHALQCNNGSQCLGCLRFVFADLCQDHLWYILKGCN